MIENVWIAFGLGIFLTFPKDFEFSVLLFEDLVTKELLPTITAYTVNPDNPAKR